MKRPPIPRVKWFYATDVPISKPAWYDYRSEKAASKFVPFSAYDNGRLENMYHAIQKKTNSQYAQNIKHTAAAINKIHLNADKSADIETETNSSSDSMHDSMHDSTANADTADPCVDVLEDRLFSVNLSKMHLEPVYWEGPIFEVRRGLWFKDSMPLASSITQQLESAYQQIKPYLFKESTSKVPKTDLDKFNDPQETNSEGFDMHDVVKLDDDTAAIFFNAQDAAIFPQNMLNAFQLPIIRQIGNSGVSLLNLSVIRRGYNGSSESETDKEADKATKTEADVKADKAGDKSAHDSSSSNGSETARKLQDMMEHDFAPSSSSSSTRKVEHLVLCVHGIGQILGTRYESVNFAHSINMLRKTLTSVYKNSNRFPSDDTNHKIQVLPVTWRHMVDFNPIKHLPEDNPKDPRLPTLQQLNVDGIKALRNIIGDVAMDILLYYEPKYFEQIIRIVTQELNRIYDLYVRKNPDFSGKVHILGHSLGSAISFDITARQLDEFAGADGANNADNVSTTGKPAPDPHVDLNFPVSSLFLVGCPVGMFKLIAGKNVVARSQVPPDFNPREESLIVSPKCENIYNLYHPCDPVGYRLEPLIKPRFADYQAEEVPFATDGINTQFKGLTVLTEDLQDKFIRAANWFTYNKAGSGLEENALGDIVTSLVKTGDSESEPLSVKNTKLTDADMQILRHFNKRGRVDFSLPMGVFDISLVSAISAHVSYFEDEDTAGFILKELLEK